MSDLDTATTDELLAELRTRMLAFVFLGKPNTPEGYDWHIAWEGADVWHAIGMCEQMKNELLHPSNPAQSEDEE